MRTWKKIKPEIYIAKKNKEEHFKGGHYKGAYKSAARKKNSNGS